MRGEEEVKVRGEREKGRLEGKVKGRGRSERER